MQKELQVQPGAPGGGGGHVVVTLYGSEGLDFLSPKTLETLVKEQRTGVHPQNLVQPGGYLLLPDLPQPLGLPPSPSAW